MLIPSTDTLRRVRAPRSFPFVAVIAALSIGGCDSCKKKKETEPAAVEEEEGEASVDAIGTGIGNGLGLKRFASSVTKWEQVYVTGDESAILVGRALETAVAVRTTDGGRSWKTLRTDEARQWSSWGVGAGGDLALATGMNVKGKRAPGRALGIRTGELLFANDTGDKMRPPSPLFPDKPNEGHAIPYGVTVPAVFSPKLASMVTTKGRGQHLVYGTPPGGAAVDSVDLKGSGYVSVPYGRNAQLVSVKGSTIQVRPWPRDGKDPDDPVAVEGFIANATTLGQLHDAPRCEAGSFTFVRLGTAAKQQIVGISDERTVTIDVPPSTVPRFGCTEEAVVVETIDPKEKKPTLVRCTLDGKCAKPQSLPFKIWQGEHERTIMAVPTKKGVVAVMSAKKGAKWGLYLGESRDGGENFELYRPIGEGTQERGFYKLGMLIGLPKKQLLLITADRTGTAQRGWYVLASDDDGHHWHAP